MDGDNHMGRGGMWSRNRQNKSHWQKLKSDPVALAEHYRKKNEWRKQNG